MDFRAERIGKNETLFREVNERIGDVSSAGTEAEFLCECGDRDCTRPVRLTLTEYEDVRADATHFVVIPGHEITDVENVVAENDTFFVVAKREGGPAELAIDRDPRS